MRLSEAFGLQANTKQGSAFDFDRNRDERLKKLAERAEKNSFNCPHEHCGKKYETK